MLDIRDRRVLEILQVDSETPVTEIAETVGLSVSACWRRIKSLEEAGLIVRRVALVDRRRVNVGMTVFVAVRTAHHSLTWLDEFRAAVAAIPEIVEAYRLTGEMDYLLRVVVPSIEAYDAVYKQLIGNVMFTDISSSISMEELKFTTAVPLKYA